MSTTLNEILDDLEDEGDLEDDDVYATDAPLDLKALMGGRASDPAAWPAPFTISPGHTPHLIDLGDGHCVRAERSLTETTTLLELAS